MVWQKFSDRARESRKVRKTSSNAIVLWWAIGNWCCEHETDGFIPKREVKDVWRPLSRKRFRWAEAIQELVANGLLEDHQTAFKVHDFEHYNLTKVALEELRNGQRERALRHRSREKTKQKCGTVAEVTRSVTAVTQRDGNGPAPVPTRPEEDQRDHAPRALSERVRVDRSEQPRGGEFSAEAMWRCFAKRWADTFQTFPTQGGKSLGDFHERVLKTASEQQLEPRAVFEAALEKYLARDHDKVELRAPYACFANAWSELTAQPKQGPRKTYPGGVSFEEYRERTRREVEASQPTRVCGVRV